jgi:hypothetical protein
MPSATHFIRDTRAPVLLGSFSLPPLAGTYRSAGGDSLLRELLPYGGTPPIAPGARPMARNRHRNRVRGRGVATTRDCA